eukprot:TRINITY_DN7593_c0_g2_i1.p1 TRINITY_DN7593_c0_g2~~TRINITY_DN7593_c0_g2_i1.p1  ORF type:complete len:449 (-),score=76.99 TRINITY_DN7593_c0_g2_i1:15-1361(-)
MADEIEATTVDINVGNVNTLNSDLLRTPPPPRPVSLGFVRISPKTIAEGLVWLKKNPHVLGLSFSCVSFWLAGIIFVGSFASKHAEDGFWKTGWALKNSSWCEMDHPEAFIREPSNAWSTFGYYLVGLIMLHCAIYDFFFNRVKNFKRKSPDDPRYIYTTNRLRRFPTFSLAYGFANVYYAAGTFWSHSCLCEAGARIDITGMYAVLLFPVVFMLYEFYPVFVWFNLFERDRKVIQDAKRIPKCIFNRGFSTHLTFIWTYLALALLLFIIEEFAHPASEAMMALLLTLVIITNCLYLYKKQNRRYLNWRYLVVSGLMLIGGLLAWILDMKKIGCNPASMIQGHAAWHLLVALAILFIYFYYRTEKALDEHEGLQYDPLNQEMSTMRASSQYGEELEDDDDAALDYDSDLEDDAQPQPTPTTTPSTTDTTTASTTTETTSDTSNQAAPQ